MSERYSKIFSLPENLYSEGAPAVVRAGALLKDNETDVLLVQLKLHSISQKAIKLIKVELKCLDSVGRPIGDNVGFEYLDFSISRCEDFGSNIPIKIVTAGTRAFSVKITEVGFADNTVWISGDGEWSPLEKQNLKSADVAELKGYKAIFGDGAKYALSEQRGLWLCACGEINHSGEECCCSCNSAIEELRQITSEQLKTEARYQSAIELSESKRISDLEKAILELVELRDYKDSSVLINQCKERIYFLRKKGVKKKIKLSFAISGGVLLLAFLGIFLLYPLINFWLGNYRVYINMYNVEEFTVPDGVEYIEPRAFLDCTSLESVTIPDSVIGIGEDAFYGCTRLTSITVPFVGATKDGTDNTHFGYIFGADSIYDYSYVPSSLKTVIITGGSTIGEDAFRHCESIESITIPKSVASIRKSAFFYCTGLKKITIPQGIVSIGEDAFYGCTSLESITIPDSMIFIGEWAFHQCTSLENVYYIGTEKAWKRIDIGEYNSCLYKANKYYNCVIAE